MSVNNINSAASASPVQKIVNSPIQKQVATDAPQQLRASDRLELSGASHLLQSLKANSGVRADKVASIKAQIEAGNYEDDAKMNVAIDRLLEELQK